VPVANSESVASELSTAAAVTASESESGSAAAGEPCPGSVTSSESESRPVTRQSRSQPWPPRPAAAAAPAVRSPSSILRSYSGSLQSQWRARSAPAALAITVCGPDPGQRAGGDGHNKTMIRRGRPGQPALGPVPGPENGLRLQVRRVGSLMPGPGQHGATRPGTKATSRPRHRTGNLTRKKLELA
jgi:hypothetical protein